MILFKSDWERFPNAIVDYETTNQSFLRMASVYRDMGVENNLFLLSLLQPELQGVDPFSDDLSEDVKIKIGLECAYNIWYYLREVVRIPPVAGPSPLPYRANRGNIALTWSFMNNIDIALIQPRQTGKSVSTDCISNWIIYIGATNTEVNMITKDHTLRTANVDRLKKIRNNLPTYLVNISSLDSDNQTDLTCKALDNVYKTAVGQTSESSANKLGRGLTSPVTHIDEGPFIRYIETTLPAALASGAAAREEAKKYNRPYGNVFTTTAGKKDDRDGRYMYDLIHGGAIWNELFLDAKNKADLLALVTKNCSGRKTLINATFSHRQLGYTDEWLYDTMATVGAAGEMADRDFFNVWTSGTQSSPLSPAVNQAIRDSEMEPIENEISSDSYILRWYVDEYQIQQMIEEDTHIILGMDTSDAIGRDSIALTGINEKDLSTVCSATINETNLIRFSKFVAEMMIKYPNIIAIPERKSSGQAIIDSMTIHLHSAGIDPFKRIYNTIADNYSEKEKDYQAIQTPMSRRSTTFYDAYKKYFGFNTTGGSRDLLYSTVLQNAAKKSGYVVRDRTLSNEIRGLVVKNGKIDHSSSGHDDMVVAWLLSNWFLTHSKNLQFYGVDPVKSMSGVNTKGRELTLEEEHDAEQQVGIKKEVEGIYQKLGETTDEFLIARLENQLMALNSRIKEDESEAMSIDALINQAAEKREYLNKQRLAEQRRQQKNMSRQSQTYRRFRR